MDAMLIRQNLILILQVDWVRLESIKGSSGGEFTRTVAEVATLSQPPGSKLALHVYDDIVFSGHAVLHWLCAAFCFCLHALWTFSEPTCG